MQSKGGNEFLSVMSPRSLNHFAADRVAYAWSSGSPRTTGGGSSGTGAPAPGTLSDIDGGQYHFNGTDMGRVLHAHGGDSTALHRLWANWSDSVNTNAAQNLKSVPDAAGSPGRRTGLG